MVFYLELPLAWSDGSLIRQIGVLDPPLLFAVVAMCATVFASFADTASAHFLLDVNIRVFHVVHEQDRIRLLVRLPMSYLVADKLGPDTAGGTRAPAPYTTNRLEDGKVVHYLKEWIMCCSSFAWC